MFLRLLTLLILITSFNPLSRAEYLTAGDVELWVFEPNELVRGLSPNGLWVTGNTPGYFGGRAFRWSVERGFERAPIPALTTHHLVYGVGISDDGTAVGDTQRSEGFVWYPDGSFDLMGDVPGGIFYSEGKGVSGNGDIVVGTTNTEVTGWHYPARWTKALGIEKLSGLPSGYLGGAALATSGNGGVIVGYLARSRGSDAFVWRNGAATIITDSNGGQSGSASGVSFDGRFSTGAVTTKQGNEAFLWTEAGGLTLLGDLPGGARTSVGLGVSDNGAVVGVANTDIGSEGFVWSKQRGLQNLRRVLIERFGGGAALAPWTLDHPVGISRDGKVIIGISGNRDVEGALHGWVVRLKRPIDDQPPLPVCRNIEMSPFLTYTNSLLATQLQAELSYLGSLRSAAVGQRLIERFVRESSERAFKAYEEALSHLRRIPANVTRCSPRPKNCKDVYLIDELDDARHASSKIRDLMTKLATQYAQNINQDVQDIAGQAVRDYENVRFSLETMPNMTAECR